jgi:hypothetical protein
MFYVFVNKWLMFYDIILLTLEYPQKNGYIVAMLAMLWPLQKCRILGIIKL